MLDKLDDVDDVYTMNKRVMFLKRQEWWYLAKGYLLMIRNSYWEQSKEQKTVSRRISRFLKVMKDDLGCD